MKWLLLRTLKKTAHQEKIKIWIISGYPVFLSLFNKIIEFIGIKIEKKILIK